LFGFGTLEQSFPFLTQNKPENPHELINQMAVRDSENNQVAWDAGPATVSLHQHCGT
jgi:hypothetical protein